MGGDTNDLLETLADRDETEGALGRHSVLLGSLVVLLAALPIGQAFAGETTRFSLLLTLVLIAAVVVNSHQRWIFVVAVVIGSASLLGINYAAYFDSHPVRIVSETLGLALLGFTTLVMFNSLIQADQVSEDAVIKGICVYFLIGLCFALVFILITDLNPGVFLEGDQPIARSNAHASPHATLLLYFSFVTLTTLGYGDVTPVGDMARMFAVAEAVIGQLYLAIFVARLIALYVMSTRDRSG